MSRSEWVEGRIIGTVHHCHLPAGGDPGSVWECRCGQRWAKLTKAPTAHLTWQKYDGPVTTATNLILKPDGSAVHDKDPMR